MDQRRLLRAGARGAGLHRRRCHSLGTGAAGTTGARRSTDGVSPRFVLAMHGHAAGPTAAGVALGQCSRPVEDVGMSEFWRDRPALVTGASGLLGGWLVRRLIELRADVVCLVRDWVPQCELVVSGHLERVKV